MKGRALFVGNFLSGRGTHRHYCEELTDRLEDRGWQIVRTSTHHGRVRRLVDMLHVAWKRRDDFDVAHVDVFSGAAFVWAEAACFELARLRKPVVLSLRGGNLPAFAQRWPRRVRRLLSSARSITAPSPYLATMLARVCSDVAIVPNAIEVARYPYSRRSTPSRLVWLRAFHEIYNPVMAVDVVAHLHRDIPTIRLEMVGADKGDGSLQATQARARQLGVEALVTFVPGIPKHDVPARLAAHDIYLNTANVDNTPVSVLEAMACGLCVVSTSVGGIPYLLRDGVDACLVDAGDVDAMTAAVRAFIGDRALSERISSEARARASTFDWQPVLDRWEHLLDHSHA